MMAQMMLRWRATSIPTSEEDARRSAVICRWHSPKIQQQAASKLQQQQQPPPGISSSSKSFQATRTTSSMSDSTPLLPTARGDHEVEFDRRRGTKYRQLLATLVWALLFSIVVGHMYAAVLRGFLSNSAVLLVIFLLFGVLRVVRRWQRKEFDAQKCTVTDRRVVIRCGWLNRSIKFIPLDRIQDVNIHETWLHRMFKIKAIEIQTAGSGRPHCAEGFLLAPANATSVRDAIMERRDKLVLGLGGDGGVAPYGIHSNNAVREENVALSMQVRELKESMVRIEGLLDTGLKRFTTKDQYVVLSVDEASK